MTNIVLFELYVRAHAAVQHRVGVYRVTYTAMIRKTTTPTIATIVVVVPEEASLEAFNKASDWRAAAAAAWAAAAAAAAAAAWAAAAAAWAAAAASRAFLRGVSRRGVRLDWNQTRSLKGLLKYMYT